jgi:hypothetical protein
MKPAIRIRQFLLLAASALAVVFTMAGNRAGGHRYVCRSA